MKNYPRTYSSSAFASRSHEIIPLPGAKWVLSGVVVVKLWWKRSRSSTNHFCLHPPSSSVFRAKTSCWKMCRYCVWCTVPVLMHDACCATHCHWSLVHEVHEPPQNVQRSRLPKILTRLRVLENTRHFFSPSVICVFSLCFVKPYSTGTVQYPVPWYSMLLSRFGKAS